MPCHLWWRCASALRSRCCAAQMGAFLDMPIVEKETERGEGHGLQFALSSMQGWRNTMEDAHCAITSIKELPGCAFFGVFDGHAGSFISVRRHAVTAC